MSPKRLLYCLPILQPIVLVLGQNAEPTAPCPSQY